MEQVVPWARLMEVIEPYYPESGKRGRPPIGLERMLRMYFVQQWCSLADEAAQDAVYDSQALRNFMGIDLSRTSVPEGTTLMGFRHLLEAHDLTKAMLMERGLLMTQGTLVDATADCGTELHEKQSTCTRSRNAPDQERQPVALRHEGTHWSGQGLRPGPHAHHHCGERQ